MSSSIYVYVCVWVYVTCLVYVYCLIYKYIYIYIYEIIYMHTHTHIYIYNNNRIYIRYINIYLIHAILTANPSSIPDIEHSPYYIALGSTQPHKVI